MLVITSVGSRDSRASCVRERRTLRICWSAAKQALMVAVIIIIIIIYIIIIIIIITNA